jgi:hypothetical protein
LTTMTIKDSTLSGNTARDGGGVYNYANGTQFATTILLGNTATNTGHDCHQFWPMQSHGHNLTGTDTGCPSDATLGDLTVEPAEVFTTVLGPLRDNGGPTFTHALRRRSPALDAGDPTRCRGTDHRGVPRPQGEGCDIGAFERDVP